MTSLPGCAARSDSTSAGGTGRDGARDHGRGRRGPLRRVRPADGRRQPASHRRHGRTGGAGWGRRREGRGRRPGGGGGQPVRLAEGPRSPRRPADPRARARRSPRGRHRRRHHRPRPRRRRDRGGDRLARRAARPQPRPAPPLELAPVSGSTRWRRSTRRSAPPLSFSATSHGRDPRSSGRCWRPPDPATGRSSSLGTPTGAGPNPVVLMADAFELVDEATGDRGLGPVLGRRPRPRHRGPRSPEPIPTSTRPTTSPDSTRLLGPTTYRRP